MKVVISGKGGSGKSTIATLLARALSNRGFGILVVDGDESNVGLHRLLGGEAPVNYMDSLGGKKGFKEKRNTTFPVGGTDSIFAPNTRFDDIPDDCVTKVDGIRLLAIGKIHDFGEGCACPMGALSKTIFSNLVIKEDEIVIVDTAAGVEHFGRGIDATCDMIIDVVDPTYESFMLAQKMEEMTQKAGKNIYFVMNKVDEKVAASMNKFINPEKVVTRIPANNDIFMNSLKGEKITANVPEIEKICNLIETKKKEFKPVVSLL